jgi:hypothetical protein
MLLACALLAAPLASQSALAQTAAPTTSKPGPGKMRNCPTAVEGASTKMKKTKDGVELTVTGGDKSAEEAIRARAQHLADVSGKPTTGEHSGTGTGGGGEGRAQCAVIMKDTAVTSKDVKGGAKITVKAKDKAQVGEVQKLTAERVAAASTSKRTQ